MYVSCFQLGVEHFWSMLTVIHTIDHLRTCDVATDTIARRYAYWVDRMLNCDDRYTYSAVNMHVLRFVHCCLLVTIVGVKRKEKMYRNVTQLSLRLA